MMQNGDLETTCFDLLWASPFNFTTSNTSAPTDPIAGVLGSNDGKLYTLSIDTTTVTLRGVLPESQASIILRRNCATAPNPTPLYWSV